MKQLGAHRCQLKKRRYDMILRHRQRTRQSTNFRRPDGVRARWRLLIFMAIVMAMSKVARMIITRFFPAAMDPTQLTPMRTIAPDLLFCFILAVAAWIMSKIEARRMGRSWPSQERSAGEKLSVGLLIGLLATSTTVLSIFVLHGVRFTSCGDPSHRDFDRSGRLGAGVLSLPAWPRNFCFADTRSLP